MSRLVDPGPIFEGDTFSDTIRVEDDGTPIDISGWEFTVTIGDVHQTTITNHDDAANGKTSFEIDTSDLAGKHVYDIQATTGGGDVATLLIGTINFVESVSEPRPNHALQFDGGDDYAVVSNDASLNFTGSFSITADIIPLEEPDFGVAVGKGLTFGSDSSAEGQYSIEVRNDAFRFTVYDGTTREAAISSSFTVGEAYTVSGVYDDSEDQSAVWTDGTQDATKTLPDSPQTTSFDLNFGRDGWRDDFYTNLVLDNVAIHGKALTADEIQVHAKGGLVLDELVSYWEFNEGDGATASDSIGSNEATVNGASWVTGL